MNQTCYVILKTFKVVQERVTPIQGLDTCIKLRVETFEEIQCKDDILEGLACYKECDM